MNYLRFIFIFFGILMISSCSGWGSYMMTNISNKHDGSLITNKDQKATESKRSCHQWCHNGWCSTHCEPVEFN